jgi:hypothetical protein
MNESNHTPGEWEIRDNDYFPNQKTIETDGSSRVIAVIDKSDEEDLANARLIAAAPELLEVLEKWAEFMRENYAPEELSWYGETEAAISKARGGQNDTR